MCIVVDINTYAPVFNERCSRHSDFRPVKEWIENGNGFLVFGGTRYKEELQRTFRYLRLVRQMKVSGQAVAIDDSAVDSAEEVVRQRTVGTHCNDQHIIALLGVSRCPLFCSQDASSFVYIKSKALYPDGMERVRIYSSVKNTALLRRMCRESLRNRA